MSKWAKTGLPCPNCDSSDAYSIDREGAGFCFSCREWVKPSDNEGVVEIEENVPVGKQTFEFYAHRGLTRSVVEFYNLKTKMIDGVPHETGFFYPDKKGFKFRRHGDDVDKRRRFYSTDGMTHPGIWGKEHFDPGSKESITIVEGLYDAPSVYQMLHGATAAVAVSSSSSALRDVTEERDYINSFKKIYLAFDNDVHGQEAQQAIISSGLFDYMKLYVVKFHKYKDPNEYLEKGDANEFKATWKSARRYTPDNIISTFSEIEAALQESTEDQIGTYPFKTLNELTYGFHEGEIVVFKGPEGIGKTEIFRAIEHHVLKTTKHPIGILHLEEDNATTIKALAGYELQIPATLPDCGLSPKQLLEGYKKAVQDDEGRVHIYSSFDVEDEAMLLDNIRFLASAAGCKLILLDHISWLATGMADDDERKKLDRISQKLKLLAKELKICIMEISHVNDDGKTRGSRNISKVANTVVDMFRDKMVFDPIERQRLVLALEKVRLGGKTGPAGFLQFNPATGILEDGSLPEVA